jgi:hypothetical protein
MQGFFSTIHPILWKKYFVVLDDLSVRCGLNLGLDIECFLHTKTPPNDTKSKEGVSFKFVLFLY